MNKQPIQDDINELGNLYAELFKNPNKFVLNEEKKERANKLIEEIIEYLIWFPGALFYNENEKLNKKYKIVVDLAWENVDSGEIFDKIAFGGYSGVMGDFMDTFSKRVKKLKPTFISINPNSRDFGIYYEEAMKAWVYGLDSAALILSYSILEDTLRNRLCLMNSEYALKLVDPHNLKSVQQFGMKKLIEFTRKEKILSFKQLKDLENIQKKRNDAVHNLYSIPGDEVYDVIMKTKDIVEYLFVNLDS